MFQILLFRNTSLIIFTFEWRPSDYFNKQVPCIMNTKWTYDAVLFSFSALCFLP